MFGLSILLREKEEKIKRPSSIIGMGLPMRGDSVSTLQP